MKRFIVVFFIFCFFLTDIAAYAADLSLAYMGEDESGDAVYLDKKTSQRRSELHNSMQKAICNGRTVYKITQKGKGNFDKFVNITWYAETEVEEKNDGYLYPFYSKRIIRDIRNNIVVKYEKKYDYDKKKIFFSSTDSKGKTVDVVLPMKGKTVDDVNMVYFLKAFAGHPGKKGYKDYFYISDEPKLYHMVVKDAGKETLDLPIGKKETVKLRLIIDLGFLTGVARIVVPPTYAWFADDGTYMWLQYDGLETNLSSPHILLHLLKIDK